MALLGSTGLLIISLFVLIKASDYFIESAEKIGLSFGMPPFVVGVVIVGIGTSLPELVSSIIAVLNGSSEIVIGNVLGSNITNILLILGLGAIIGKSFKIEYDLMRVDLPFFMGASFIIALMIWDSVFSLGEAIICIICLVIYIVNSFRLDKDEGGVQKENNKETHKTSARTWLYLLISSLFIFLGAKFTIDAVVSISTILKIGKEVIALSVISLGTSLPEVMVTISAARRGKPELTVGNIIGSNIFNTFAVMGIPSLFGRLTIPPSILEFSLPVSLAASFLYLIITIDKRINRWEGGLLLIFYLFFISRLYGWV